MKYLICFAAVIALFSSHVHAQNVGGGLVSTLSGLVNSVLAVVGLDGKGGGILGSVLGSNSQPGAIGGILGGGGSRGAGSGSGDGAAKIEYTGDEPLSSLDKIDQEALTAYVNKVVAEKEEARKADAGDGLVGASEAAAPKKEEKTRK